MLIIKMIMSNIQADC